MGQDIEVQNAILISINENHSLWTDELRTAPSTENAVNTLELQYFTCTPSSGVRPLQGGGDLSSKCFHLTSQGHTGLTVWWLEVAGRKD